MAATAAGRKSPYRTRRSIAGRSGSPAAAAASSSPAAAASGSRYSLRRASVAPTGGNGAVAAASFSKASSGSSKKSAPATKWGVLFYLPNIIGACGAVGFGVEAR
jgi:hypothetical protein